MINFAITRPNVTTCYIISLKKLKQALAAFWGDFPLRTRSSHGDCVSSLASFFQLLFRIRRFSQCLFSFPCIPIEGYKLKATPPMIQKRVPLDVRFCFSYTAVPNIRFLLNFYVFFIETFPSTDTVSHNRRIGKILSMKASIPIWNF